MFRPYCLDRAGQYSVKKKRYVITIALDTGEIKESEVQKEGYNDGERNE